MKAAGNAQIGVVWPYSEKKNQGRLTFVKWQDTFGIIGMKSPFARPRDENGKPIRVYFFARFGTPRGTWCLSMSGKISISAVGFSFMDRGHGKKAVSHGKVSIQLPMGTASFLKKLWEVEPGSHCFVLGNDHWLSNHPLAALPNRLSFRNPPRNRSVEALWNHPQLHLHPRLLGWLWYFGHQVYIYCKSRARNREDQEKETPLLALVEFLYCLLSIL